MLYRALTLMVALAAVCCSPTHDVNDGKARYACSSDSDCVTDWSCLCGFCQPAGGPLLTPGGVCKADGGSTQVDAGQAKDTGGAADTNNSGIKNCNLVTWKGCGAKQGCYFDDAANKPFCTANGGGKENTPCTPGQFQCGVAKDSTPLLCDSIEKRCFRLCNTSGAGGPCPQSQVCYGLESGGKLWPQNAGICAPK